MDTYMLTLLVTIEQEYAIQKLFARHGWDFTKMADEILTKTKETITNPSEVDRPLIQSPITSQVHSIDNNPAVSHDSGPNDTNKSSEKDTGVGNVICAFRSTSDITDDDNDGVYDEMDTDQLYRDLDFVIKEKVDSSDSDVSDEISNHPGRIRNSEPGKRPAQRGLTAKSQEKKRGKTAIGNVVPTNRSDCVGKTDTMSRGKVTVENTLAELETVPDIKHVSKLESTTTNSSETNSEPADLDDTGYSRTLGVFYCIDCCYKFPEKKFYTMHKRDGKCVFPCQFCGEKYTFKNFSKYQEHLKQHSLDDKSGQTEQKTSQFVCPLCEKSFTSIYNWTRHIDNIHTLQGENQHRCHLCGCTYETRAALTDHKKSHQIICTHCGKIYSSKSSLNIHVAKLHSSIMYHCVHENCSFIGNSQQVLDFHLNVHKGVKPFKCKHCEKSYPRKDSLSRHQLLCVSGVTCDTCGTKFKSKGTLSNHIRAVHSDERFQCLCGSTFKYRANLQRHQKKAGHYIPGTEDLNKSL